MPEHTYKHINLTGSSKVSSDDAIRAAIARAAKSVRGMHWFEVVETRGQIEGGAVKYWQVTIRIAFTLED